MHNCLYKCLIEENILSQKQFSFQALSSKDYATVKLVVKTHESFENWHYKLGTLLD